MDENIKIFEILRHFIKVYEKIRDMHFWDAYLLFFHFVI